MLKSTPWGMLKVQKKPYEQLLQFKYNKNMWINLSLNLIFTMFAYMSLFYISCNNI